MTWRIRPATPADAAYIDHLMHRFSSEVGFLPRSAMTEHLELGHYCLLELEGQPSAYTLTTGGIRKPVRILQHAVDEDLWRQGWGLRLLEAAALKATRCPTPGLTLTCRDGLPANAFWQTSGAKLARIMPGGRERRKLLLEWSFPIETIQDAAASIAWSPHLDDSNLYQSDYRARATTLLPSSMGSSIASQIAQNHTNKTRTRDPRHTTPRKSGF